MYQFVHTKRLPTLEAVIEIALWVERGATVMTEKDKSIGASFEEKRPATFDGG